MSIYSGFATRNQEQTYDGIVQDLIYILSKKIIKLQTQEEIDSTKFVKFVKQIFLKLSHMQKQKYLEPNISSSLFQLMQHMLNQQNLKKQSINTNSNSNSNWVRVDKCIEPKSFTLETMKNKNNKNDVTQKNDLIRSSRNLKFRIKKSGKNYDLNPEIKLKKEIRVAKSSFDSAIKTGINFSPKGIQKNIYKIQSESERRDKHKSLRNFLGYQLNKNDNFNRTIQDRNQCQNCNCDKKQIKLQNRSGIIMPQLVKQYIKSTNQSYMKHFRRRKILEYFQNPLN